MKNPKEILKDETPLIAYYFVTFSFFLVHVATHITRPLLFKRLGFSFADIGALVGSFYVATMVVRFLAGSHSDHIGRKFYVVSSLALSGVMKIGYATGFLPLFPLFVFLDGAAFGMFGATRGPILKSLSAPTNRGKVFGVSASISSFSGVIGGLAGTALFALLTLPTLLFYAYGVVLLATALLVFSFVTIPRGRMTSSDFSSPATTDKVSLVATIRSASPMLLLVCAIHMLQMLVTTPLWATVIPLYITETLAYSAAVVGIVFGVQAFFSTGSTLVGGFLADRFSPRAIFFISSISLASLAFFIALWGGSAPVFFLLCVLFGIIFYGAEPVLHKFESLLVRGHCSGLDYSLTSIFVWLGAALGSWLAGYAMEIWEGSSLFFIVAASYLAIGVLLAFVRGERATEEL